MAKYDKSGAGKFLEKDNGMSAKEVTVLHAVRMDGNRTDRDVFVRVIHDQGINVLDAIDRCFTEWYRTKKGREAWEYSCGDFNIGDMLNGWGPEPEFTKRFGFQFLPDTDYNVIEISYDRVIGDGGAFDEEDEED